MFQSLNQYYIFYTVAQCNSFSQAAKQLYITQPAVSKAVSKLESELNAPLFYRTGKGVSLTEAGEILQRQLDTAFRAIENGEELIRNNDLNVSGRLSVGVSTTLCKYVLLPYLRIFTAENPHVKLSISCQSSYETIEALKKGTIDIGLVSETDRLDGLEFQPLQKISDVFVCTAQYLDSLKKQKNAGNDIFENATLLLLDRSNVTRQYMDRYMLFNQIRSAQTIEVSTMDLLIDFAKTGLGIACAIKEFVRKELETGTLVLIDTKEPIPPRNIGYAYARKTPRSATVQRFLSGLIND